MINSGVVIGMTRRGGIQTTLLPDFRRDTMWPHPPIPVVPDRTVIHAARSSRAVPCVFFARTSRTLDRPARAPRDRHEATR